MITILNQDEIDIYHRDGLVVPRFKLPIKLLDLMKVELSPYLSEDPFTAPDFVPDLMESGFGLKFGRTELLIQAVTQLIGGDFVLWAAGLFGKPARIGKPTPWHQDAVYWPIRPMAACTVRVAIDPSNSDNGCFRYVPSSHKAHAISSHEKHDPSLYALNHGIVNPIECEKSSREVILEPGQISIHDAFLLHSSRPNYSGQRRVAITFRYMPTTSHFDRDVARALHHEQGFPDISNRKLYLVSGRNLCKKNEVLYVPNDKDLQMQ